MDGNQFDKLAKSLAGSSRRSVLKGAIAIVFGGVLGTVRPGSEVSETQAATRRSIGEICRKPSDCASGSCGPQDSAGRKRCNCARSSDCPSAGVCTTSTCVNGVCGSTASTGGSCDDKNPCTINTTCHAGACTGTNVADGTTCGGTKVCVSGVCSPGCLINTVQYPAGSTNPVNPCQSCQPVVSATAWTSKTNGTSCSSGDLCQVGQTCQSGVCNGGNSVTCSALDQCHIAGTCNPATGTCSNPAVQDGTACNDGNPSTCNDTCQAGVCTGTAVNLQTDSNNCGSCGNTCSLLNATSVCVAGSCAVSSCNAGFANCNSIAADGCEVNTNTDVNNCGSCGHVCAGGQQCTSGVCTGCFVAGTRIAMADGTSRPIELVAVGDLVIGEHGAINRVEEVMLPLLGERKLYAFNGGDHFVTGSHPFMTDAGWKSIDPVLSQFEHPGISTSAIMIGDRLHAMTGVAVAAGSIASRRADRADLRIEANVVERIEGKVADPSTQLYNLRLDGNHTYFANDLLVHNKD